MTLVDLTASPPPPEWGVTVDPAAIDALADLWAHDPFPLPAFDYPGTPTERPETWWFDYVTLAVSVLACLWPPDGEEMWSTDHQGQPLDDAPGIFAAFTRRLRPEPTSGLDLAWFAGLSDDDGRRLFAGTGSLQLIPERTDLLRRVATTITDRWDGTAANLVAEADRHGPTMAHLLTTTMPAYLDRPVTSAGTLPFDKLSHLAAAIMAAGLGWDRAGFTGYDQFPVYPDYMLPRILRHHRVLAYAPDLAHQVDTGALIEADSPAEHAIRWATVHAGAHLHRALTQRGNPVTTPALDYRLWSESVLGPDAATLGPHHRTLTLHY